MMSQSGNRLRWIIWIISLLLCLSAGRTILDLLKRQDIVKVRENELQQMRQQNKALERSLSDMKSPEYVERIARDQLGLVKEGETVVVLPDQSASQSSQTMENNEPVWKKWYSLFF